MIKTIVADSFKNILKNILKIDENPCKGLVCETPTNLMPATTHMAQGMTIKMVQHHREHQGYIENLRWVSHGVEIGFKLLSKGGQRGKSTNSSGRSFHPVETSKAKVQPTDYCKELL